ncbi:hypothetical protein [Kluyvera intermedia]
MSNNHYLIVNNKINGKYQLLATLTFIAICDLDQYHQVVGDAANLLI